MSVTELIEAGITPELLETKYAAIKKSYKKTWPEAIGEKARFTPSFTKPCLTALRRTKILMQKNLYLKIYCPIKSYRQLYIQHFNAYKSK